MIAALAISLGTYLFWQVMTIPPPPPKFSIEEAQETFERVDSFLQQVHNSKGLDPSEEGPAHAER